MGMFEFLKANPLLDAVHNARLKLTPWRALLVLLVLVMIGGILSMIPIYTYLMIRMLLTVEPSYLFAPDLPQEELAARMTELTEAMLYEDGYLLTSFFSSAFVLVLAIVYCRFIEHRSLFSMGLSLRGGAMKKLGIGGFLGAVLFLLVTLLSYAMGGITVAQGNAKIGWLILFFLAILVDAASEEVLFRGYLMMSLCNTVRPRSAIILSGILFAVMHGGNAGVTVLSLVNVFAFGCLLGLLVFRTGSLWTSIGLHAMWNFFSGNVFGATLSGIPIGTSILTSTPVAGRDQTSGGVFGPEAGLVTTVVLLLAFLVFIRLFASRDASSDADR